MENLTHTLVGLAMARCGLEKTTIRGAGMMMLAANAPDIDAVFWFNRQDYLDYHRTYTHSFACAPLLALLPMVLVRAQFSWKAYAAALAGIISHLLLDWTNPYGIEFLLPFSRRRLMLDITNIADLWIWIILFIGLLAPMLKRGKSAMDASRRSPRAAWAWIALASLITYEGGRFALHAKAVETLASQTYSPQANTVAVNASATNELGTNTGISHAAQAPWQTIAVPADFVHPARWKGIARCEGFDVIVPVDAQDAFDPAAERTFLDPPPGDPVVAAARKLPEFQTMIRFSQAPFWKVTPISAGSFVELIDLRYGTPDNPGFASASGVVSSPAR